MSYRVRSAFIAITALLFWSVKCIRHKFLASFENMIFSKISKILFFIFDIFKIYLCINQNTALTTNIELIQYLSITSYLCLLLHCKDIILNLGEQVGLLV